PADAVEDLRSSSAIACTSRSCAAFAVDACPIHASVSLVKTPTSSPPPMPLEPKPSPSAPARSNALVWSSANTLMRWLAAAPVFNARVRVALEARALAQRGDVGELADAGLGRALRAVHRERQPDAQAVQRDRTGARDVHRVVARDRVDDQRAVGDQRDVIA